ncbi:MAG: hypothetical protein ABIO83_10075, partial [Ilumatobacteraceae bacterium]
GGDRPVIHDDLQRLADRGTPRDPVTMVGAALAAGDRSRRTRRRLTVAATVGVCVILAGVLAAVLAVRSHDDR